MAADYIPGAKGDYYPWLNHLNTEIATDGPTAGMTAGEVTAVQGFCTNQIALGAAVTAAKAAYDAALQAEATGRAVNNAGLRDAIGDLKRKPGYTPAIGENLQIIGSADSFDPATYKPEFKAKVTGGAIRLDWTKKGVDAVHIYARLRGQPGWTQIGTDSSSPFIDGRPLAAAAVPETREYMLRGVVTDAEIGLNSDIVSITWDGA